MGLENLYRAICQLNGTPTEPLQAAQVTERGLAATDVACDIGRIDDNMSSASAS